MWGTHLRQSVAPERMTWRSRSKAGRSTSASCRGRRSKHKPWRRRHTWLFKNNTQQRETMFNVFQRINIMMSLWGFLMATEQTPSADKDCQMQSKAEWKWILKHHLFLFHTFFALSPTMQLDRQHPFSNLSPSATTDELNWFKLLLWLLLKKVVDVSGPPQKLWMSAWQETTTTTIFFSYM